MFKKLDILIIRSFIGPFIVTFFVSLFVLVMQFFWLYMDELLGKGFGVWMILQLLFYMSATLVPMALPLGILLASIMTFGAMGEAYELIAIKSSGISLLRFMRPLLILIAGISVGAFFFNNNIIPVANLKALSLLYDLRNARMSVNIRAGQFNHDIPGYAIKIGEKDKDEKTIRNIIIYDGSSKFNGNDNILLAEEGEMSPSADGRFLVFRLRNGWRYEEGADKTLPSLGGHATQTRTHFAQYDQLIDLASLKLNRTNQDLFKSSYQMMDIRQLLADMAGIQKSREHDVSVSETNFAPYLPAYSKLETGKDFRKRMDTLKAKPAVLPPGVFKVNLNDSMLRKAAENALANARNVLQLEGYTATNIQLEDANLRKRQIALHGKFTLSFACVLLFLIGAPLGAIIRKGGLGLPIIVAIGFFVLYFIMSKTGEQLTESDVLPAWMGMWMSTAMLLPIAAFIIRAARNDSPLFSREWYFRVWTRLSKPFRKISKAA